MLVAKMTPLIAVALLAPYMMAGTAAALDCSNASNTHEMNQCADRDFQAADAKLNRVYQSTLAAMRESEQSPPYDAKSWENALRAAQRAWVAYRDAECKDLVPMEWTGGTGTTVAVLGCMTEKTEQRIKDLEGRDER